MKLLWIFEQIKEKDKQIDEQNKKIDEQNKKIEEQTEKVQEKEKEDENNHKKVYRSVLVKMLCMNNLVFNNMNKINLIKMVVKSKNMIIFQYQSFSFH